MNPYCFPKLTSSSAKRKDRYRYLPHVLLIIFFLTFGLLLFTGGNENLPLPLKVAAKWILCGYLLMFFWSFTHRTLQEFTDASECQGYMGVAGVRFVAFCIFIFTQRINLWVIPLDLILIALSFAIVLKLAQVKANHDQGMVRLNVGALIALYLAAFLCFATIAGITGIFLACIK